MGARFAGLAGLALAALALGCTPPVGPAGVAPTGGSGTVGVPTPPPTAAAVVDAGAPPPPSGVDPLTKLPTINTEHPRLWVNKADLPRLRAWAVPSNPAWVALLARAQKQLDDYNTIFLAGRWPDKDIGQGPYYTEQWAATLAFVSMIHPAGPEPWASASKGFLLYVMNHAPTSAAEELATAPVKADESTWYKSKNFSLGDRARDNLHYLFLAYDWLMAGATPPFTAADQERMQKVALRWA